MATTITRETSVDDALGRRFLRHASIAMDNSYPTGGEAVDPDDLDLAVIEGMIFLGGWKGYVPSYDKDAGKIMLYWVDTTVDGAPLVEVVNTTDVSTITAGYFIAIGY